MKYKINYKTRSISEICEGDLVISRSKDGNVLRKVKEKFTVPIVAEEQVRVKTTVGEFVSSLSHRMMTNFGYMTIHSIINSNEEVCLKDDSNNDIEIVEITHCGERDLVFHDLHVEGDHCYYIGNKGGMLLSHNSATVHVPFWHFEIEDVMVLKNNAGTDDNRVRKLDYSVQFSRLFYDRLVANEDITLFSPHEAVGLYEAFGNNKKFEELYTKYERATSLQFKRRISARKLAEIFARERLETGRIYAMNIDTANEHGSWNVPVYMSNLCVTGDTSVMVDVEGQLCTISIAEVVSLFESGKTIKVLSSKDGADGFEMISDAAMMNDNAEILEISDLESGFTIKCTPDHKVYTKNRGYVMAKDLEETDELQILE